MDGKFKPDDFHDYTDEELDALAAIDPVTIQQSRRDAKTIATIEDDPALDWLDVLLNAEETDKGKE